MLTSKCVGIIDEKCVLSDQEKFTLDDDTKLKTWKMVETTIAAMRSVQFVRPSIIAIEMIKAAGAEIITQITHHTNKIRFEIKSSVDSSKSIIIDYYKGKEDPLSWNNYHGLKLFEQAFELTAIV